MSCSNKLSKFCDCSIKLHMQGYLMDYTNSVESYVAKKNGGSNMGHLSAGYITTVLGGSR